jgi:glycosyltransferase involved in cell wall biosynthesis
MLPVSICLTTWNRAKLLPGTLDSLLQQSFGDFELIISDDCSIDETERVCRQYQERDSRVRYFRNPVNVNMPGNLNAAIQKATGKYVANLHDGDIYRTDLIEKWYQALEDQPSTAFVFNDYRALTGSREETFRMPFGPVVEGKAIALHYLRTVSSCVWGTVMARASAYRELGHFDERFGFISDVEMWLRLASRFDAAYVPEPLITLGERPADHPFRHGLWRAAFWAFRIYGRCLELFESQIPEECAFYRGIYRQTRRRYFIRTMLHCARHAQWERVREGLRIWRDSDDSVLAGLGALFRIFEEMPEWYDAKYWQMARLREENN